MFSKILARVLDVICVIIIVFALVILLSVVLNRSDSAPSVMGYSAFRVISGSMEPSIKINSLVIVKNCDASEVREGDVISFYSSDPALGGAINTHRVVGISNDGGIVFTTKGDNNAIADEYPVPAAQLVGRVVFYSSFMGIVVKLLQNPLVFVAIVAIPLLVLIIKNVVTVINAAKAVEAEEEQKALEKTLEEVRRLRAEKEAEEAAEETEAAPAEEAAAEAEVSDEQSDR
ncbi:MAG: signal peptidase I [Firmicutes bacterium]|nr:signal peptidase I [Bacillota bacterium]